LKGLEQILFLEPGKIAVTGFPEALDVFVEDIEDVGQRGRDGTASLHGKGQPVGIAGLDVGVLADNDDLGLL
jgi:hypothetical protein